MPHLVLILGMVLLSILPFRDKAVFLDEHLLLKLGQSVLSNGVFAHHEIPTVFFGTQLEHLGSHTHPPVAEYFLALLYKIYGGFDETRFRLTYSILFSCLAALAFWDIAKRFTRTPTMVTALFVASPAFFVMSPALMADIPALAFLLAGFASYFRGVLWAASFFFALALATMYPAAIPFGALMIWMVFQKKPWREVFLIAAAPAAVVIWLIAAAVPIWTTASYMAKHGSVAHNAMAILSFAGGSIVFPWLFIFLCPLHKRIAIAAAAAGVLAFFLASGGLAYTVMASSGIVLLFTFLTAVDKTGPHRLLFSLWIGGTLLFFVLAAEMIAARYLLLAMPPLYLVCFKEARWKPAMAVLLATLTLSFSLALSDYELAGAYRTWANQTVPDLRQKGFHLWSAAESGLRFYLEQHGVETLHNADLRPAAGDLIVRHELFLYGLANHLETTLVRVQEDDRYALLPMRTLSPAAHAGFHDSRTGILPYSFSTDPMDRIILAEVSPLAKKIPQVVPADFCCVPVWSTDGVILKQIEDEMEFRPRMPSSFEVLYEVLGDGALEINGETIRLTKRQADPVVWKNLRIVPK